MKTPQQILEMQEDIEQDAVIPGVERGMLIMALEWVLDEGVSTSLGLEDWLKDEREGRGK